MTTVVTGARGFIGQHLTQYLRSQGDDVVALARADCDMLDAGNVRRMIANAKPERIFHLAAQSLPGRSWEAPADTFRVNVEGTLNLMEAVRSAGISPSIVVACSSSQYAVSTKGEPIRESDPMEPSSPYGISKLAMDHLARLYAVRYKLNILRVRPFFLIGTGKVGDVCSDLAQRVAAVERNEAEDVPVGQLDIVRDFLDVRDGTAAIALIAAKGRAGEAYNVCSGRGYRIAEVVDGYKKIARRPLVQRPDPALLRPIDEPVKIGNPAKLKALGWTPRYGLEESLAEILSYWRGRPGAGGLA